MDTLISVAGIIAEYTVAPIGRQAGYLLFYKGNFKELEDHVEELEAARERLNHRVVEERGNAREIESDVVNWLKEVNEVIEKANRLQEDPRRAKVGCSGWSSFPNLILRHRLSRNATKIAKDVAKVKGKGNFDQVGYLPPLQDGVAFSNPSATRGGEKLKERESFKERVVKALKDPSSRIIGVYGLGGVGKSTLVKEVAQIAKQDNMFDKVVIALVSQTEDIKRIQGEIADRLDLRFQEETVAGRADRLRQRIKLEETILIILDDIWTRLDLDKVGIPYGCKLLMTSRNQQVLQQMGAQTFRLELLGEVEAWSLFQSVAGDVVNDNNLKAIATEVAKKCSGLPLCLAMMAQTLKDDRDVKAWKDALRELDHAGMDEKTHSVFKFSYNALENDEMKPLFLLVAVLHGNSVEYILRVAIGLDILKDTNTADDARNKFYRKIESLKASCLLLDGSTSGKLQMHDLVRNFAISIACKHQHVFIRKEVDDLKEWLIEDFLKSCPQIILNECHIPRLSQRLYCPNIKLFYLVSANRYLEISDTFFEGMGSLKVLDLSYLHLPSLPTSFRSLISLQTLCLDQCLLENMDAIGALKNLEILSLSCSSMIKLPCEIASLTQLRMLDLSHSGIEVIPPNIISCLTKLEELYMGNTSIKWEDENSAMQNENASLVELRHLSHLTALELQICAAWILPSGLSSMFERLKRYKIAIGEVWEWADIQDESLNTLMLKLSTSIHLEHGIKALIERVESLYLDQVDGIHNVLYQLNREGFPLLKHLHIQNNANLKHIIDSVERNQDQVSFINLETLVLQNLKNLEQICHGPLAVNSFGNLSVIKVKTCVQLKYLLSFSMVKGLSQLSEIEVCQCNSMEEIVLGDNGSIIDNDIHNEKFEFVSLRSLTLEHLHMLDDFFSYELTSSIIGRMYQRVETRFSAPLFSDQVSFPKLDTLRLSSLKMNKIWYESQHSMKNLANLVVENCGGLKYLFSSTMVEGFKSLKRLEISKCHLMGKIIATDNGNNGTVASNEPPFPKLETIILKDMENLKAVWHYHFDALKTLKVVNCEKIVVVFPSSMQKTYRNLEMLEVTNCALVEEVFELTSGETSSIEDATHLKWIVLDELPKLKRVWSMDPQGILSFRNLEYVVLNLCRSLEYLFPLSVATCCSHLKELCIKNCGNVKEIVAEKNESVCTAPILFDFNQLNTLLLWNLVKLKGFYAGNHTLTCSSLRKIDVCLCSKLNMFKSISTSSPKSSGDGKLPVLMPEPAFIVEEVIPNLEMLRITQRDANVILQAQNLCALFTKLTFLGLSCYKNEEATIFPYWFLQNVCTLEVLSVERSSFKKVFQDERQVVSEKIHTRLKKLSLHILPRLQHICEEGSRIDPVLEFLEHLEVEDCPNLTNLLPSSVTFNHLTYLEIINCNGLINLITSYTARSLDKLTTMVVKDCNSLEEIITGEENVGIAFIGLETLTMECLPRLNKFCSSKCFLKFPLLEEVVVRECPRMKIFSERNTSTPNLRKVKIAENGAEWHWKGNLNDTIKNMFEDKVAFGSYQHLKLSEYPELKELWYGQLQHNVFRSLKYLVVHKCDFLSDVLFQPNVLEVLMNLEELDISDCNLLEAVFDLKGKFAEEILLRSSTQLKKLTLSDLPKLKHVWKEDPHNTLRFQNLSEVSVTRCESLISLFPLSVARDILELQNLEVNECGIKEIVAKEEGAEEIVIFVFPRLISIGLSYLPKLKAFFAGIHSLQCKFLKTVHVFGCPKLELFMTEPMSHQERTRNDKLIVTTYQPFFKIEEVLPIVENLTLNKKDFDIILQSRYSGVQFSNVKLIRVSEFTTEEDTFPYWFLKNVPSLEALVVQWSSFREIFQGEGSNSIGEERETKISTPLRKLTLHYLHKLQHICKEGIQMDPVLQHIQIIYVHECSSLIKLVPSSVTFTSLTYLEVTKCNGLINLITCSTAKSLVKLTTMKIKLCNLLEDVVNGKKDETNEIAFCNLQSLELISLPRLCRFCSCKCPTMFPLLEEVVVKECPRMEIFSLGETSTPNLQNVQTEENYEGYGWEGDLNGTIKKLFDDKVAFGSYQHLKLSEYPELKELWYDQLQHNVFRSLKHLVVHKCDFLSDVLFQPNVLEVLTNLEELDISHCNSLEAVFDLKGKFAEEILVRSSTQLKKLALSDLPKLKHVWKEDPHNALRFQSLSKVSVARCKSLISLFPLSVARDILELQNVEVNQCGIKEIVAKEEGMEEIVIFEFPRLISVGLINLPKLKAFFAGIHSLQCNSLKSINVFSCPKLEQFMTKPMRQQERARNDKLNVATYQPLFKIEEVLPIVKKLTLNKKDFDIILQSQYSGVQFSKVKFIRVSEFTTEEDTFPYWFLKNVPCLETLVVQWSSFTKIFQGEGSIGEEREAKISTPLRQLTLQYLHKLEHICKEGLQMDPVLQHIQIIYVHECSSLIKLVPFSVTFTSLTYLEVTNCNGLINLITCSTAKSLVKLTTMKIKLCDLLEDVVNGKEDETNNEIAFCNLQSLELISLPRLCRFCSCMCPTMFPLLEEVVVKECPRMEIFSLGETSTPNLQSVQTEENDEGYGWKGDLNGTIKELFDDKVAFGSYQHLKLSEYPELKELWYGQFQHNVFRSMKYLVVHKCDFLSDVLFQPNVLEVLLNLEELDISHCNSLEAVFDLKGKFAEEILVRSCTQLKKLTLSDLPKLRHVWKEDPHNTLRFQSLSEVSVTRCKSLISLFPLSVARDILELQNLQVNQCGIKEIVAKEEGMEEKVIFVFPRLISIGLSYLPKLKAFFAGIHSLQCKSLKTIKVLSCPKLELFMTDPMRHQERARDDKLNVATYQPLFKIEEVLPIVENLTLDKKDFDIILRSQYSGVQFSKVKVIKVSKFTTEEATFPYWFLKNVPCLETLVVQWSSFKEVFQCEGSIGEERETKISTPLRKLTLHYLHKLQHICKEGFQMDPVLQLLETIYVQHCSSLIKLVPSSVTFTSLTYLEVTNCNGLINLITCSTAKSLVKLTTMKIKLCNLLEDIVNGKEDETNNEIAFCNLLSLELISLPRLCKFCSCMCPTMFPLLEEVVVKECPRMEIFSLGETSTPNLQNVQTEENDEGYVWEGDLNGTIKKLFDDKVAFRKFKGLTLSEYPELKYLWYGQLHDNVLCNLKSLVVQRCDFLSDTLFPSNVLQVLHGLEDLVVRDCDSLETVFDVKGMMSKEILIKQRTQLKRLTLSSLPKLKHIWNEDPYEIISFGNLCMVDISVCESLLYIFPLSLCEDLGHLEVLRIVSCGAQEIVAMEKGTMKCSFNFPQLTKLVLSRLTNHKSFYPEKHTLECPSLKILNVYRCEALRMFSFTDLDFQQPDPVDGRQALFSIEKLSPNLEQLAINGTDALRILNVYQQENTFHKIEILRLQCFDETPTIFLNDFYAVFPNLVTLQVRNSSFETLFPTKGTIDHLSMQISKQVRTLWLFELAKLKYIWQEDFPLDHPLLHDLEELSVWDCPSLISLVPSSTTFTNLTSLKVENCKELIYLMTSSTAKSLVQLTILTIINCEKLLDVVKIDEERAKEDIIFENLECLKFTSLSCFRSFCHGKHTFMFPSLLRFVVKGCPQMKIFSSGVTVAPFLTAIEVENEKMRWKDDLNTTIEQLFIEQELSHSNDN